MTELNEEEVEQVVRKNAPIEPTYKDWSAAFSRFNKDRSTIAKGIIVLYATVILAIVLYLLVYGISCNKNLFDDLIELVKISVLPVVTLVIGFYFGSSR